MKQVISNLAQKKSIPRDLIQVGGSGIVNTDGEQLSDSESEFIFQVFGFFLCFP